MRAYIKKLQSKEEVIRKQILAGSLIVSMSIVAFVWMYSLGDRFGNSNVQTAQASDTAGPFKLLGESISNTYQSVTASVANFSLSNKNEETKQQQKQIDLVPVEPAAAQ